MPTSASFAPRRQRAGLGVTSGLPFSLSSRSPALGLSPAQSCICSLAHLFLSPSLCPFFSSLELFLPSHVCTLFMLPHPMATQSRSNVGPSPEPHPCPAELGVGSTHGGFTLPKWFCSLPPAISPIRQEIRRSWRRLW